VADPQRRAAVLGRPIGHSRSPALHQAAYAALGLNWSYEAIECGTEDLAGVLETRADWAGFSCTMPLKRAVLEIADEVRPLAAAVGAGNTLLPRPGGGWIAENTDVAGIVATVRGAGRLPQSVTVLGAGGTAQAVVGALAALQLAHCTALVRDPARTAELKAAGSALGVAVTVDTLACDAPALRADLVVSTLPGAGANPLAGHPWTTGQIVLDVVYDPWPTPLAAAARAAGATVLSGAQMLLYQAAAQVELMTGRPAPVGSMEGALRRTLDL
jgi:shikimate dehydrogenase